MSKFLKVMLVFAAFLTAFVMLPMMALQASSVNSHPAASAPVAQPLAPNDVITFTILHTNDFHGQLEASNTISADLASNPGMARTANVINMIRAAKGADNVLLVDGGDEMQGSLLSNLQKGEPTIATFKAMSYTVATFGNHEFDWGQTVLSDRMTQAGIDFPHVSANIVTGTCDATNWTKPPFVSAPYVIKVVGTAPNTVTVAFIGVTTQETPQITIASATAGLCFKDPADSILHYYDEMKAQASVIVVLSHLGYNDGGYGYGIPVYGDQTLAGKLNAAGKPVNLIIGGHSHTTVPTPGTLVGQTTVVQAAYNGRRVGEADFAVGTGGAVTVTWKQIYWRIPNLTSTPPDPNPANWRLSEKIGSSVVITDFADTTKDPTIDALITTYASDPAYVALVNTPIGYSAVDLPRNSGVADNMMGTFIDDAIYNYLNTDGNPANDIDLFFNNAGGIRTDWCWSGTGWTASGCVSGTHAPGLLTYGNMFTVLPFGNATVVGKMTGSQIMEVVNYGPNVTNGVIQPAGLKYTYYAYTDTNPGPQPYAWGAYNITVKNRSTGLYEPLVMTKTYSVGTNEFLAPAGGDGYGGFKYMTNVTYWGDMLNAVNSWVSSTFTITTPYMGPNNDGTLDGRIVRNGTGIYNPADPTQVVPVTILHHNDSHGNLVQGAFVGYTQLATLIKQERLHNPGRTLLLNGGDSIQGDSMMYYFKSAPTGFAADGTPLPITMTTHPMIAALNAMNYTAMTLGNHEFNFGKDIFVSVLKQANFPILQANLYDDGRYGISQVPVKADTEVYLPGPLGSVKVAILGIGNHRVPNYELPSNIVGLTFTNPITEAQRRAPALKSVYDAVVALTHIGFTTNPKSVEVDNNVDTNLAAQSTGIDAIIGSHSHTNPASPEAPYKQLPTYIGNPNGTPVLINQAYRYNNTLGEVVLGMVPKAGGGYQVVSRAGRYLTVQASTAQDPQILAIVAPYSVTLKAYNDKMIGYTAAPIDTTNAYTDETNAANLQADASMAELHSHNIYPDFHLSGAMTQSSPKVLFTTASPTTPMTLTVGDTFKFMPYENSLVTLRMNGPQLKAVLERGYRNYFYYKYVSGQGGYSYYTTCMLDTNHGNQIQYRDGYPFYPNGNNVAALLINSQPVNFLDATKYYTVSTVNYLAAGSCNFSDNGVSLWPLNQIVNDTQYYVRDAVIDYVTAQGTVTPTIEGRLQFSVFNKSVFLPLVHK